jgi:hypothetical protein
VAGILCSLIARENVQGAFADVAPWLAAIGILAWVAALGLRGKPWPEASFNKSGLGWHLVWWFLLAMIAFRIEAGALVSCPDFGPRMIAFRIEAGAPYPIPTLSPRERRRAARQGTRGRRGARRVAAERPYPWPSVPEANRYETFVGHLFGSDVFPDVMLYLPEGEKPTSEHGRMLLEALRRLPA